MKFKKTGLKFWVFLAAVVFFAPNAMASEPDYWTEEELDAYGLACDYNWEYYEALKRHQRPPEPPTAEEIAAKEAKEQKEMAKREAEKRAREEAWEEEHREVLDEVTCLNSIQEFQEHNFSNVQTLIIDDSCIDADYFDKLDSFKCNSLYTVEIARSVKFIDWNAFKCLRNLRIIRFAGFWRIKSRGTPPDGVNVEVFKNYPFDDFCSLKVSKTLCLRGSFFSRPGFFFAHYEYPRDDEPQYEFDGNTLVISGNGDVDHFPWSEWERNFSKGIVRVIIEDGITSIGEGAFKNCPRLKVIQCLGNVDIDGAYDKDAGIIVKRPARKRPPRGRYTGDRSESQVLSSGSCGDGISYELKGNGLLLLSGAGRLPNYSVTAKPPWVKYLRAIRAIEFGEHITSIGNGTFFGCRNLQSVEIPDSVTYIGHNAFRNCSSLKKVQLPSGLWHLGNGAFQGCTNLDLVKCGAKFVKSIGSDVFQGCDALECVVAPNCKMSDFGGKPITSSDPDEEEEGSDSDDALSLELSD